MAISIEAMSTEEKLHAMELLWDDSCRRHEEIPLPEWHADLLREREAALASGEEVIEDWEDAKRAIRDEIG